MHYRIELDGIRAIAVLSVVLFHAGVTIIPGGYVGVDIFFVLSGFLITSIIYKQINSSSFTFSDFYWRRFRRILPALFFMIFVVGLVSYKILVPELFKDFAISAWTTALFSSNIYFWTEAGYFQKAAELKPLLHTWSLGVEEQYYIFFPFLMIFIAKWAPRRFTVVLMTVGILSLLLSIYAVYNKPIATFYLLPTRLWELLVGSLLAVSNIPTLKRKITINLVSWTGLALLSAPMIFYSDNTIFPGLAALPPCLGTVLIIWSLKNHHNTSLKRILSFKPLVFVGKVSYSFYLWHWPVLVLCKYYAIDDFTIADNLLALFAAFLISCFSWLVVEKPFRTNFETFPKRRMFELTFTSIAAVTLMGMTVSYKNGMPSRFDVNLVNIIAAADDKSAYTNECNDLELENPDVDFCSMGTAKEGMPRFLLWGDSHAGAIAPVFDAVASEENIKGTFASWSGCPPLLGVQRKHAGQKRDCLADRKFIKNYIEENKQLETIILFARWSFYVENKPYGNEKTGRLMALEYNGEKVVKPDLMVQKALEKTVSWLKAINKKVVIIMPVPEVGLDVPSELTKLIIRPSDRDIRPTMVAYQNRQSKFFDIAEGLRDKYGVKLLYPHEYMCDQKYCNVIKKGIPLYFDDDHLSIYGAMQLNEIATRALIPD